MQPQIQSTMRQNSDVLSSDDLADIRKRAEAAITADKKNNENFKNYWRYTFENCLTDDDKDTLQSRGKDTLSFNTLRTYVLHYMKNVKDSEASVTVETDSEDSNDDDETISNGQIAQIINDKYNEIEEKSSYNDKLYQIGLDQAVGGKGIWRVKSEYENNYNFKQNIILEAVADPTCIYFDPAAKCPTKKDSDYCIEKVTMGKEEFNRTFPDFDFDKMKSSYSGVVGAFSWVVSSSMQQKEEVIYVCDYYYKVYQDDILYELIDGTTTTEKPKDNKKISRKRKIENCNICMVRIVGDTILQEPKMTVFKHIPFVVAEAESYIDADGNKRLIPYAKHGFDAIRTKTFLLNYYVNQALENNKPITRVAEESLTKDLLQNMRNPAAGGVQIYKALHQLNQGELVNIPPPQDIPPLPLPQQLLEAAAEIDQSLQMIYGSQFPSTDEINMSGKALYNLAQFMSASNEILMQNLYLSVSQVATVVIGAMEAVIETEAVAIDQKNGNIFHAKFDYIFEPTRYHITIRRGVSHKLQQEATIERMLQMAQQSPLFAQFLNTPEAITFLLENQDLNNKSDIMNLWEQFAQKAQEMQAQMMQNPAQQMQAQIQTQAMQADMQAKTTMANAKMLDAQTRAKELELTETQQIYDQSNQNQTQKLDLFKTVSQNRRDHEANMVKVADIQTRNKHFLIDKITGAS